MRQLDHLTAIHHRYPGCWQTYARFLAGRGQDLPDWPAWCYCPLAASYAIVSGGGDNRVPLERIWDVATLAALAAWRPTKGIYRYHDEMREALLETPIEAVPEQLLYALPEWCVYVETPGHVYGGIQPLPMHGFYAHLEGGVDADPELRLLIDLDAALVPSIVHLGHGTLTGGVTAAVDYALDAVGREHAGDEAMQDRLLDARNRAGAEAANVAPLVSLLLYLCSEAPDLRTAGLTAPAKPARTWRRTSQGPRLIEARHPQVWETAYTLGRRLRQAREAVPPTGHTVMPHVRRAHWHTFWTGRKTGPVAQQPVLRWLHPILVHGDLEPPTTIHRIG